MKVTKLVFAFTPYKIVFDDASKVLNIFDEVMGTPISLTSELGKILALFAEVEILEEGYSNDSATSLNLHGRLTCLHN